MQQKAANEFVSRYAHELLAIAMPIIFPAKAHRAILDINEPIVEDGNTVRVATDVVEYLIGLSEGRLGVNHPLDLSKGCQITLERLALAEVLQE